MLRGKIKWLRLFSFTKSVWQTAHSTLGMSVASPSSETIGLFFFPLRIETSFSLCRFHALPSQREEDSVFDRSVWKFCELVGSLLVLGEISAGCALGVHGMLGVHCMPGHGPFGRSVFWETLTRHRSMRREGAGGTLLRSLGTTMSPTSSFSWGESNSVLK